MYSEKDIKKFFAQRGEIEMELGIYRAQYHNREDSMPTEVQKKIDQLERNLLTIDSCFHALSTNERFVIQLHIVEQLDWPQIISEYIKKWGPDSEKTVRSLQICQAKALKKISRILNQRIDLKLNSLI